MFKKYISKILIIILLIAIPASSFAASSPFVDANGDSKFLYVALGDSVTTGMGTSSAFNLHRTASGITANSKDYSATCYPSLVANQCKAALDDSLVFDFSNWGIPGYRLEEFNNLIANSGNAGASSYWALYSELHSQIISDLQNADLITINLGSNDLLQGFVYDMVFAAFELNEGLNWSDITLANFASSVKTVKNPLFIQLAQTLMGVFIGDENIRADFINLINIAVSNCGGIKETNPLENILDLLVFIDSANIERGLKKSANKAIDQYNKFVKYLTKNINDKAEIALINTFYAYGNSFKASVLVDEENNPSSAKIQSYTLPAITNRIFNALKEINSKAKDQASSSLLNNLNLDSLKEYLGKIDKDSILKEYISYVTNFKPLVDTYELPTYMSLKNLGSWLHQGQKTICEYSGNISEWLKLGINMSNPVDYLTILENLAANQDAISSLLLDEIIYPLRYILLGKPIKNATKAFNSCVKAIAVEYNLKYIDITGLVGSANGSSSKYSSWNPHPNDFGHKYIANRIIDAIL